MATPQSTEPHGHERTRPWRGRGAVPVLLAVVVLAVVAWWMFRGNLVRGQLGPGDMLVGRAGVDAFLVGDAEGWRVFTAASRDESEAWALPARVQGLPRLDRDGRLHVLVDDAVLRWDDPSRASAAPDQRTPLPTPGESVAAYTLAGVDGAGQPVLGSSVGDAVAQVYVRDADGADWRELELRAADGTLHRADPMDAAGLVVAEARGAVAFRGRDGWEAWSYDGPVVQRLVASGCRGAVAAFSPDGTSVLTDGRVDGIWILDLQAGRQGHLAEGNLGACDRVAWSAAYRGDPVMLLAPQWDIHGYLQLFQTHLSGGGRWRFSSGSSHHYSPALTADGRHLAYAQADFDKLGSGAFTEDLYLYDFDHVNQVAVRLGRRPGGKPHRGPAFVGKGCTVVWIASGRVFTAQRLSP